MNADDTTWPWGGEDDERLVLLVARLLEGQLLDAADAVPLALGLIRGLREAHGLVSRAMRPQAVLDLLAQRWRPLERKIQMVSWSPDGTRLAWTREDETLRVSLTGSVRGAFAGFPVRSVTWSPDGASLACVGDEVSIKSMPTWETGTVFAQHSALFPARPLVAAWSPDGKKIASGGTDQRVLVWLASSGRVRYELRDHAGDICALAWSPDGTRLLSGSAAGAIHIWTPVRASRVSAFDAHSGSVTALAWSPDGTRLASGGLDGTVQVWDAATGAQRYKVPLSQQGETPSLPLPVAWSPDGRYLASAELLEHLRLSGLPAIRRWAIRVWDAGTGTVVKSIPLSVYAPFPAPVHGIAWSPDSARLAVGVDRTVQLWRVQDAEHVFTYHGHRGRVLALGWSPGGTHLASGDDEGAAHVWSPGQ